MVKWDTEPEAEQQRKQLPEGQPVTHPPPAALPEVVPPAPDERAVWLDGYWRWETTQWVWVRGGWVHLREGDLLVPARFWFTKHGGMRFAERSWLDGRERPVRPPEIVEPAATPPLARLAEDSTLP